MTYRPVPLDPSVPPVLAITLWDFSWYVRAGVGEPFEDLDRAFGEAVDRGYNTVRLCAMPFLLFRSGLDTSALRLGPLGGDYAQRTRWYDVGAGVTIDARARLLELFRAAQRHDVHLILSSWEYQQSTAFADTREWFDAALAVPAEDRLVVLADAFADLVDWATEHGVADRIAFTELHNEVQLGHLTQGLTGDPVVAIEPRLVRGLARFHERHPGRPVTVNYAGVPTRAMRAVPREIDVLVVHPYVYGVLDQMIEDFGLRGDSSDFAQERARRELLRPDAPACADWAPPGDAAWKLTATIVGKPEIYLHDWCDPEKFDRWLYERYGEWRHHMAFMLDEWIRVAADRAAERGIPLVLGEGWVGYTPLAGRFEEGPVGAAICREAMRIASDVGARGSVVCSNAAPHHPMWADVELQRDCLALLVGRRG